MTKLILSLCTLSILLTGCDRVAKFAATGSSHPLTVIPSAAPTQLFEVTITDERYLTNVARRLATTVDAIIADNNLPDSTVKAGQRLKVLTTRAKLAAFLRGQQARQERREKRAEKQRLRAAAKAAALQQRKHHHRARKRPRRRPRRRRHATKHRRAHH